MRVDKPLDADVASLVEAPRGHLTSPGSDVAVNKAAPVVTGDAAMDTQLENLRSLLCDSVLSTYAKVTRTKNLRLWSIEARWGEGESKMVEASRTKRSDHPAIQNLIQMAAALARIDANSCEATVIDKEGTVHKYICAKLQLQQEDMRIDLFSKIQSALKDLDKSGMDALKLASDTVKSFHTMAQQWKMHVSRTLTAGPKPQSDLQRLAEVAFRKEP